MNKKIILIGLGVLAVAGIGYYMWKKKNETTSGACGCSAADGEDEEESSNATSYTQSELNCMTKKMDAGSTMDEAKTACVAVRKVKRDSEQSSNYSGKKNNSINSSNNNNLSSNQVNIITQILSSVKQIKPSVSNLSDKAINLKNLDGILYNAQNVTNEVAAKSIISFVSKFNMLNGNGADILVSRLKLIDDISIILLNYLKMLNKNSVSSANEENDMEQSSNYWGDDV